MTNLEQAAKFYLLFNGKNGTKKQIEKLMNSKTLNEILSVFLIITLILLTCYIETI